MGVHVASAVFTLVQEASFHFVYQEVQAGPLPGSQGCAGAVGGRDGERHDHINHEASPDASQRRVREEYCGTVVQAAVIRHVVKCFDVQSAPAGTWKEPAVPALTGMKSFMLKRQRKQLLKWKQCRLCQELMVSWRSSHLCQRSCSISRYISACWPGDRTVLPHVSSRAEDPCDHACHLRGSYSPSESPDLGTVSLECVTITRLLWPRRNLLGCLLKSISFFAMLLGTVVVEQKLESS